MVLPTVLLQRVQAKLRIRMLFQFDSGDVVAIAVPKNECDPIEEWQTLDRWPGESVDHLVVRGLKQETMH